MAEERWARLRGGVTSRLRRGAWYRVLRLGAREAVLDVARHPFSLARSLLEFSASPPAQWTVVQEYRNPTGGVPDVSSYAVCPNCRRRVSLVESPSTMRCPGCNGLFEVAWEEGAGGGGLQVTQGRRDKRGGMGSGGGGLQPDRRTTRRRLLARRRQQQDRRICDRRRASARASRGRRRTAERRRGGERRTLVDRRKPVGR